MTVSAGQDDTVPSPIEGDRLPGIARMAIGRELGVECPVDLRGEWLRLPGASFVTLEQVGRLRGCIGSLEARRSLLGDVQANALAAAFRDPRFPPLTRPDFDGTTIEVSVLSPPVPLASSSEAAAEAQLRPGVDGVLLQFGRHRATFLPQVWEKVPDPADFLAQLKRKAGLPPDFWHVDVRLSRYTVKAWHEGGGPG